MSEKENDGGLCPSHYKSQGKCEQCGLIERSFLLVIHTLSPCEQAQRRQYLRLHLQCDVEVSDNVVRSKGDTSPCPEDHHA